MDALTSRAFRHAARLYRAGVEGAGEQLVALAREHRVALREGRDGAWSGVAALDEGDEAAERIAAAVEAASGVRKGAAASASELAWRLAERAEHRADGTIGLDVPLLRELVALPGFGALSFGARRALGVRRLRAILREIRGLDAVSVVLTAHALVITYRAPRARGHIRLHLHPPIGRADTLDVPLTEVRAATPAIVEAPLDAPHDPGGLVELPYGADLPKPHRPPSRPFLDSLLRALHDALRSPVA